MKSRPKICPALLGADVSCLQNACAELDDSQAHCLHVDVMDGDFAPYISFGHGICNALPDYTSLPIEVHFAVARPLKQLGFYNLSALARIIVPVETITTDECRALAASLQTCDMGLAICPDTDLKFMVPLLSLINKVVVLTADSGSSDVKPSSYQRVQDTHALLVETNRRSAVSIQVDGGIRNTNIDNFFRAGAHEFVCASAVFKGGNTPAENIRRLIECASFSGRQK